MVAFAIAAILIFLRPLLKIRIIPVSCLTIGHYSLSIEVLLCKMDSDLNQHKEKIIFLQKPKAEVCNTQLYKMWKRIIPFSPDALYMLCEYVESYLEQWLGMHRYKKILGQASHDRWDILETSKQHLRFTDDELIQGQKNLINMGVPLHAKFICLIVRDEAYYLKNANYNNMSNYRNADIDTYQKAALFLANNGYFVIRMGKDVSKAFSIKHNNIIDYATSQYRSDFMDIYLSAHCYFFMTTLCGLDGIAHAFRVPMLATNITPNGFPHLGYPVKLFITKKIVDKNTGKFISFERQNKIFGLDSSHEFIHKKLQEHSLAIIDNSEDEILAATKEMLAQMQGNWCDTAESDVLQRKFWSIMRKKHAYLNGVSMCQYEPRYCNNDLLHHQILLEEANVLATT